MNAERTLLRLLIAGYFICSILLRRLLPSPAIGCQVGGFVPYSAIFSCFWRLSSKPHMLISCLIVSTHLIVGLPVACVPLTSIFSVCFTFFSSSIHYFNYHNNIGRCVHISEIYTLRRSSIIRAVEKHSAFVTCRTNVSRHDSYDGLAGFPETRSR